MKMVPEGVRTTEAAQTLGKRFGVELPIASQMGDVLAGRRSPSAAVEELMLRRQRPKTKAGDRIFINGVLRSPSRESLPHDPANCDKFDAIAARHARQAVACGRCRYARCARRVADAAMGVGATERIVSAVRLRTRYGKPAGARQGRNPFDFTWFRRRRLKTRRRVCGWSWASMEPGRHHGGKLANLLKSQGPVR